MMRTTTFNAATPVESRNGVSVLDRLSAPSSLTPRVHELHSSLTPPTPAMPDASRPSSASFSDIQSQHSLAGSPPSMTKKTPASKDVDTSARTSTSVSETPAENPPNGHTEPNMTKDTSSRSTSSRTDSPAAQRITDELLSTIGAQKFDKWFGHATMRVQGHDLRIATDSQFVANWIGTHFKDEIRGIVENTLGSGAAFRVEVDRTLAPAPTESTASTPPGRTYDTPGEHPKTRAIPARSADGPRPFRRVPVFRQLNDFIVGSSNELAYAAARRIAEDNDPHSVSPLFLHGECGVGKTHLLQGICHRFAEVHPRSMKARYVTGEQFTNEYIAAVRNSSLEQFRKRIRQLDLLVIDDIHFLASKMRTQSEFLHTLDAIDLTGARVVLASDAHPRQIKSFRQALTSRFMSGMVVQVQCPDRSTRVKIIERLAGARGLRLNDAAVDLVASNCIGSVRELEGAITKLTALKALSTPVTPVADASPSESPNPRSSEVGAVLAEQLFADHGWQPASPVRMGTVIDVVCERLKVSRNELVGTRRHRRVVLARALIAHLGRILTTHSYPEIAQSLGRAYHSTVHTAAQRLKRQLDADEEFSIVSTEPPMRLRELVDQLRHEILRASARS